MLDRALFSAREHLDTETELAALAGGWLPATEVFALRSREALEGSVVASVNNVAVEHYSVQPWVAIG